jgi:AraC-like DNA-binding protein
MADISMNLYAIILMVAIFQSFLFVVILTIRGFKQNNHSDFLLALLVFIMGLSNIPHLFGWLGIAVLWNELTFYPWNGLELAVLPTVFLLLQSRLNSKLRISPRDLKNYWLYILYFAYHIIIAVQGKEFAKWWWFEVNNYYNIDAIFSFCNVVLFFFFINRFFTIYSKYQAWSANYYSNLPPLSISWIRNFLIAYFVFILVDSSLTIMELLIGAQYDKMWWAYLANFILVYYVSIYGLSNRPDKTLEFTVTDVSQSDKSIDEAKKPPTFTEDEIKQWQEQIQDYIEANKPYLNPAFRISEIAQHFSMNVSQLSTLINLCFNQNFNDLINSYRIKAFMQRIKEGQLESYTLMSLAYDSGFNSKTTFNRAFKKYAGISPSEYLKNEAKMS